MFTGILIMVPDATMVRLVNEPSFTVAFWRLLLTSLALLCILLVRYGINTLASTVCNLGRWGVVVSILAGTGNFCFIVAVELTSVAHVVLILATSPFWAALLSRALLGYRIPCKTWLAMPIVLGGVALIVSNGLNFNSLGAGEAVAALIPIMSAGRRTILRWKSDVDMLPALALGSFLISLCLFLCGTDISLSSGALPPLLTNSILLIPMSNALLYEGARFLPSSESSLIMCVETALSPICAWAVLGDQLTLGMLLGGSVVIAAIACHAVWPASEASGK